jgi:hypothetical protein
LKKKYVDEVRYFPSSDVVGKLAITGISTI